METKRNRKGPGLATQEAQDWPVQRKLEDFKKNPAKYDDLYEYKWIWDSSLSCEKKVFSLYQLESVLRECSDEERAEIRDWFEANIWFWPIRS